MPDDLALPKIDVDQRGARLTITGCHPGDRAEFLVNEVVEGRHFHVSSCEGFRGEVVRIWGAGGLRSTTPHVARTLEVDGVKRTVMVPVDREGWVPFDGRLGPNPDSPWPPME